MGLGESSWVKNGALGEMGIQRDFGLKLVLEENGRAKGLLG